MTDSFRLIDKIQFLNQQRLQNVKGAHEDMLVAILELKYEVQLPWDTLWENRFQVGAWAPDSCVSFHWTDRSEMFCSIGKRMAIEMGLVQAISDRGGAPVSAKELSAGTRFDQRVIGRSVTDEIGLKLTVVLQSAFSGSLRVCALLTWRERMSSKLLR